MKKHLDWKRIGWTFGIPLIISACVFIPYWIGMLYRNIPSVHEFIYFTDSHGQTAVWLTTWLVGLGNFLAPALLVSIIYCIFIIINNTRKLIVNFFYHNGSEEKK